MNTYSPSSFMDIDDPSYSRWSYAISDARSEPVLSRTALPTPRTTWGGQPELCLPPISFPPSPVQISPGVWQDEDGVYYSPNWPPVQEYLDHIRKEKRMLPAPTEIIFVLAALDVVYCPWDVAHWIFWPSATYYNTADRVSAIALQTPRLIITKIPWIGSREYRWIVNAIQEKYYYVHILGKWYPTDFQPLETRKRVLRSNGGVDDRQDTTINQFFNIVDDGAPPLKRLRKSSKKTTELQLTADDKRPRGTSQHTTTAPTPTELPVPLDSATNAVTEVVESPSTTPRSSKRVKRKVSPRTPRILTATDAINSTPTRDRSPISDLSLSSLHSRNRSTSSEQTVVAEDDNPRRFKSVDSTKTTVAPSSPSKKRKAEALDEVVEDVREERDSQPPEGMVTRSKIARISEQNRKRTESLSSIPSRTKYTQKIKSRKPRA